MKLRKSLIAGVLLLSACQFFAGGKVSLSPVKLGGAAASFFDIDSVQSFPSSVIIGRTAVAVYKVTNNTDETLMPMDIETSGLLPGMSLLTGAGFCNSPTFSLAPKLKPGASCNIGLSLVVSSSSSGSFGLPVCLKLKGIAPVCQQLKFPITIIPTPTVPADSPVLTSPATSYVLTPGVVENVQVTNTSTKATANNVIFNIPDANESEISSQQGCATLAPGASCTMKITGASGSSGVPFSAQIQGVNTQPLDISLTINSSADGTVTASDVNITKANTATKMIFTNNANATATINSIAFSSGLKNLNVPTIPASCQNFAGSGGTCVVNLSGGPTAHGSGVATIHYTIKGLSAKTATANVAVTQPTVSVAPTGNLVVAAGNKVTATVTNNGAFAVQAISPLVTGTGLSLDAASTCTGSLAPAANCTAIVSAVSATAGASGLLAIKGDNITAVNKNIDVTGSSALTLQPFDNNGDEQYTQYKAIEVLNETGASATVSSVNVSGLDTTKIEEANPPQSTDTLCSSTPSPTLANGQHCLIWFHALDSSSTKTDTTPQKVKITVNSTLSGSKHLRDTNDVGNFNIEFFNTLVAGGSFSNANMAPAGSMPSPGLNLDNISQLFAGQWQTAGGNSEAVFSSGEVKALAVFKGEEYVAGTFSDRVVRFDSETVSWFPLSKAPAVADELNGQVNALIVYDDSLYAGGNFTRSTQTPNLNYIAKWDAVNQKWVGVGLPGEQGFSGVGTTPIGVNALYVYQGDLYAGGSFINDAIGGVVFNNIAAYNSVGNVWQAVGSGFNGPVHALAEFNGKLIAGGSFTTSGAETLNHVARSNGGPWGSLGPGSPPPPAPQPPFSVGVDGDVFSAATFDNAFANDSELYVGGNFTKASADPSSILANGLASRSANSQYDPWKAVGGSYGPGVDIKDVRSFTTFENRLYVGGAFKKGAGSAKDFSLNSVLQLAGPVPPGGDGFVPVGSDGAGTTPGFYNDLGASPAVVSVLAHVASLSISVSP